jgi:proteic killer suppression protein
VTLTFSHKGLEDLNNKDSHAGVDPNHASKLRRILLKLKTAKSPNDMNIPGWNLHRLKGKLSEHWAVTVSGNWRVTFVFSGNDIVEIDYVDYH